MAQRKKSEVEFIQDTFCPQVAVLCSYDAEVVCRKNSLTFVELVQPFCRFNGEIKITDPSNNLCNITNLRVEIKDINYVPPQPQIGKKILNDSVLNGLLTTQNVIEKQISINNYNFIANVNTPWFESWRDYYVKIGYPGDHEFLKHYISCIFVVSTSHLDPLDQFQKLLIQQQQQIQSNQSRFPKWFFPNFANIYKYFVLLHDVQEGEISKAHQIYENLKNIYGSSNCHLLQINSKQSSEPQNEFDPWLQYCKFNELYSNTISQIRSNLDPNQTNDDLKLDAETDINEHPLSVTNLDESKVIIKETKRHGAYLALSDHDRIKTFISEFLYRGLVPYAERTIKILNEQSQSKKSILKSFSIPRKLFGSSSTTNSKTSSPSAVVSVTTSGLGTNVTGSPVSANNQSLVTISNNSINTNDELNQRRLADLAFMFRIYDLAYASYYSCKKEFSNLLSSQSSIEQIMNIKMYLAGALEMASISNFMQNFSNDHSGMPVSNSSNSLSSLSLTSNSNKSFNTQYIEEAIQIYLNECKNMYFSTRSVLLSTEALRANNLYLKAAYQFINLANDESDIRTALFLEQAALCFLAQPQPWARKYAFFMSLAGHRYNKTGQRKHSLRVYKHAFEIYQNKSWFKVIDQINYTMSRQNYHLKNLKDALNCIENILVKKLPMKQLNEKHHHQHHHHKSNEKILIEFSNESNILRDFIIYNNLINSELNNQSLEINLPHIPLPIIDHNNLIVNLNPIDKVELKNGKLIANNQQTTNIIEEINESKLNVNESKVIWQKLEENLYMNAYRTQLPIMFKPQINLYDKYSDNKQMPKIVVDEWASIEFEVSNSLKVNLILNDCTLLWKFIDQTKSDIGEKQFEATNETSLENDNINQFETIIQCSTIKEVILAPFKQYKLRLLFKPKRSHGHLHILGIKYKFSFENVLAQQDESNQTKSNRSFVYGKQLFDIRGVRLNNNQQTMRSVVYETDNRLNFKTINKTALLQVEMDHLPNTMLCNQLEKVRLYFINKSSDSSITNLKIASNGIESSHLCFDDMKTKNLFNSEQMINLNRTEFKYKENNLNQEATNNETTMNKFKNTLDSSSNELIYNLENIIIKPNEHYELDMWIRATNDIECEQQKIYLMFFYEELATGIEASRSSFSKTTTTSSHNLKYRILRFEFTIKIANSIANLNTIISNSQINQNLLINLELMNKNMNTNFELIETMSVSDIWKSSPIINSNGFYLKSNSSDMSTNSIDSLQISQAKIKNLKKSEEILSVVFKSEPFHNQSNIFISKSTLNNSTNLKPNDFVYLYFIRNDLKNQLVNLSNRNSFLNIYIIWKFCDQNEDKYLLLPLRIIEDLLSTSIEKTKFTQQLNENSDLNLKTLLLVNSFCEPFIKQNFFNNNICTVDVCIEIKNLSNYMSFELAIVAKNPINQEFDKNYLWIGCNRKYLKLKSNKSKKLKFKLGFVSNGVYEIGKISNENMLKMNLLDATSLTSFDDLIDTDVKTGLMSNKNLNMDSASICVFFKNEANQRFELLKRLNPFTVVIN